MNDILIDENYDLKIASGDFVVGECLNQQVGLLLLATKGCIRQHPNVGVGLNGYLLDNNSDELTREIRAQFKADGLRITNLEINNGDITIAAAFNNNLK